MIFADLQIHSRFSRACSKYINFSNLERYARIKGLNLLSTGDFQHPKWNKEIKDNLKEDENGILWSKNGFAFLWGTEISLMYSDNGRRAVHLLVYVPNKEIADQVIEVLGKRGRLDYDGRPIFGMSCPEFVEILMEVSKDIEIVTSHSFTSYFGVFGSKSGFDSIEECFKEKSKYIHAMESGMSADPDMIRLISKFDKYNIVSFSDAHSFYPWRLGRETTVFDCELSYKKIINAIRTGKGISFTIETPPEYGRYHLDGHRGCGVVFEPEETEKRKGICPRCKKPLTVGVLSRVLYLADRKKPENVPNFKRLVPLHELIAAVYGVSQLNSTKVWEIYNKLVSAFENEFNVLLNVEYSDLVRFVDKKLADVIIKNREDKLTIKPGYDGVYGEIILDEKEKASFQKTLSSF
jgi:uncharacterized protein (TIGR00375 family)